MTGNRIGFQTSYSDPIRIGIGEYGIITPPTKIATYGLGSCLAIVLDHPTDDIGGMIHVMLPEAPPSVPEQSPMDALQYVDVGVDVFASEFAEETNLSYPDMNAKIVGGSDMLSFETEMNQIGIRNVRAVDSSLSELGIPVVGTDVGGDYGRSVVYHPADGSVVVRTAGEDVLTL